MKYIFYPVIFFCAVVFFSCEKQQENNGPSACFMVDMTSSNDPTHVFNFTNCSDNYSTSSWNFGDGHSSLDASPSHRFNNIGEYTVTLTITNSDGATSTNTRTITIGHYSLIKIVYSKLNGTVNYPKHVYWSYYNSMFGQIYNSDAAVSSISQMPFSVVFFDDPKYDNYSSNYYRLSENDFVGHSYNTPYFNISDLEILNGIAKKTLVNNGDSAVVSLYFAVVPR